MEPTLKDISFFDYGMMFTSKKQAENEIKFHGHYNSKTGKLRRKQPTCVKQAIAYIKNNY